ncbi:hypothetical protein JCM14244_13240 [Venenivibrio stagnispumantis]|uniref:Predicted lipid-binding transport protein, Tim44 family n=1 Tax=Venenivibrio stagnispumantis TaxID=407998 RepID=A0AA45WKZ9_9AQUI|nr:Tim44-like domain-containing protein [Venenivibrio stagnispumantis]MCW4573103.1 Tim44-like domain-containing protein [Venenivibrio stagnispumantis]SMP09082.1 Predicted lipid-binding transport protein, Tim44 family [Venenivibrio stagnispumantis]
MFKKLAVLSIFLIFFLSFSDSFARVGGGKSSGFRSYNSYQFKKQTPSQLQQNRLEQERLKQSSQPVYTQKPSFFSNPIFKWLIGGMIFGALLSWLMGHGFQIGTPGLLEILLIAGIIFLLFKIFTRKREEVAYEPNISPNQYYQTEQETITSYINEELIKNLTKNIFISLQEAWSKGDLTPVKNYLTDRMYNYLNNQLNQLKQKGLRNIVENININNIQVVHVEEEGDNKVVIVEIDADMIDYIIDQNGNIVEGSKDIPTNVKEYWAFVGKALNWKLDDIKQIND